MYGASRFDRDSEPLQSSVVIDAAVPVIVTGLGLICRLRRRRTYYRLVCARPGGLAFVQTSGAGHGAIASVDLGTCRTESVCELAEHDGGTGSPWDMFSCCGHRIRNFGVGQHHRHARLVVDSRSHCSFLSCAVRAPQIMRGALRYV